MIDPLIRQYLLTALTLILIGVIAVTRIGAVWLRRAFIASLITMLPRRIDAIGVYFGVDIISNDVADLLTFAALLVILIGFIAAYQRRAYLSWAERQREAHQLADKREELLENIWEKPTIKGLEELRENDIKLSVGYDWQFIRVHRVPSRKVIYKIKQPAA